MTKLKVAQELIDLFYPVGTYYETSNTNFNPNTEWGGTWVEDTGGRVTMGSGNPSKNTTDNRGAIPDNALSWFYPVNERGGQFDHQLTITEMPSHNHWAIMNDGRGSFWSGQTANTGSGTAYDGYCAYTGQNAPHNIIQPYIVVKRWHRTA